MKFLFIKALFLLMLSVNCFCQVALAQQIIKVPEGKGKQVLIDGKFSLEEWSDASVTQISDSVKLYLKQFKNHVFLGVKTDTAFPAYVDLFVQTDDKRLFNLHSSMQIGERELSGDAWTDNKPEWQWGNHVDWIASEVKLDSSKDRKLPIKERVFPYDGAEFQIRRARFPGKNWRIRIEVRDFNGAASDVVFPSDSTRKEISNWAMLRF